MKYIPIIELPVLILLVLIRSLILKRRGIKALVFGKTDKSDFILVPFIAFFFYAVTASFFDIPFPEILRKKFWEADVFMWVSIGLCSISLIWFTVTLAIFGNSFRVGIDESTKEKLITSGTFSVSRNPIYTGFIGFFLGIFVSAPNICTAVFLILLTITIHRQILREEKFLLVHYWNEYKEYCKKTRRYL